MIIIRSGWCIRAVYLAAAAMLVLLFGLISSSFAQDAMEAAYVRGHFGYGDDVWRASDFGWFYYDLDKDQGGEELKIDLDGRTAEKGHLVYSSSVWSQEFEYKPWGSYQAVAFFGKPYLAGYRNESFTEDVSDLEKGELREVLIDEDLPATMSRNSTISLRQGYVLAAAGVSDKRGAVNMYLLKNGQTVYASVVDIGDTFVYKVNDVPLILVHISNAMRGNDDWIVEVDGVFQVSDQPYIQFQEGGLIGEMKLLSYSEDGFEFQNDRKLIFGKYSIVSLTDDLQIVVLDLPDLVYYPVGRIIDFGKHEIRGPTFSGGSSIPVQMGSYQSSVEARWDSSNYSGFYYDPENMIGNEHIVIYGTQGRAIPPVSSPKIYEENNTAVQSGIQYTSIIQPKDFEYKPWGHYYVISFPGVSVPWFAGYDSTLEGPKASKSLLEMEYLGVVLRDAELMNAAILAGNYTLDEGYEMRIRDVDNDSIFIQLLKDGAVVDSSVVKSNSTYVYKKDLKEIDDMPIIKIHFGGVFDDGKNRFATIDGIFQISDQYIMPVEPGYGIGELEIVAVLPSGIIMVNDDQIKLNRDSTVNIAPAMNIRIADNESLRYYLYTNINVVPAPDAPAVRLPGNITSAESANFSMIENAAELRQVLVNILDADNRTVFSRDLINSGQGSGEQWIFDWQWNASVKKLSDNDSFIPDTDNNPVLGLLFLNKSTQPRSVYVSFDSGGRIGTITDGKSIYYISREDYGKLNLTSDYDSMVANSTARKDFLAIVPKESILQLFDIKNYNWIPSGINHTLQGDFEDLEPHIVYSGAKPGKYELQIRIENAVNAIWATGQFFNVTPGIAENASLNAASKDSISAASQDSGNKTMASPAPGLFASSLFMAAAAYIHFRRRS